MGLVENIKSQILGENPTEELVAAVNAVFAGAVEMRVSRYADGWKGSQTSPEFQTTHIGIMLSPVTFVPVDARVTEEELAAGLRSDNVSEEWTAEIIERLKKHGMKK